MIQVLQVALVVFFVPALFTAGIGFGVWICNKLGAKFL